MKTSTGLNNDGLMHLLMRKFAAGSPGFDAADLKDAKSLLDELNES
jgi:hypothetical protein